MRKLKVLAGLAVLVVMFNAGWQIGKCELTSVELHDDMKDMASQIGARIGFGESLAPHLAGEDAGQVALALLVGP